MKSNPFAQHYQYSEPGIPAQDLDEARRHLRALDPTAQTFHFQTFDDDPERKDPALARTIQGSLDECAPELINLNSRGAGVFVTVNEIEPGKPRKAKYVTRARAVFVDVDKPERINQVQEGVHRFGVPTSGIVESSPDKFHLYWLTEDCPLDEFKDAQKALAEIFRTDPNVNDLPRVLRLAGFIHRKGAPFRSMLHQGEPDRVYPFTTLLARIKAASDPNSNVVAIRPRGDVGQPIAGARPKLADQRRSTSNAAAQAGVEQGWFEKLTPEKQNELLRAIATNEKFLALANAPRKEWRDLGWGFADGERLGATEAKEIARQWSKDGSSAEHPFTEEGFENVWKTFDPNRPNPKNIGTLIKAAKEVGFDTKPYRDLANSSTTVVRSPSAALWVDDDVWDEVAIPKRPWVAPRYALRGSVTGIVGPPSAAKSLLTLSWCCATALGKPHGDFRPAAAGNVIVYNVEDNRDEQRRRLSASLKYFNATPNDIRGKLTRTGPSRVGTLITMDKKTGVVANTSAMNELRELIKYHKPLMLVIDPLVELHDVEENDNTSMRAVVAEFRSLAVEFDMAVVLVHHTRKGEITPGDLEAFRGASSTGGAGRCAFTFLTMSEADAKLVGIPEDRKTRSQYVRLDDAKQNYGPLEDAEWYEKKLYTLGNGEVVPATVPWKLPNMWALIPIPVAERILTEIGGGIDGGKQRYSAEPAAGDNIAAWKVIQKHVPALTEEQARKVIRDWIKEGFLVKGDHYDEVERKNRKGLFTKKKEKGPTNPSDPFGLRANGAVNGATNGAD